MKLGYCTGCGYVRFEPNEPKLYTEAELQKIFGNEPIPEPLRLGRSLFVGVFHDPATGKEQMGFAEVLTSPLIVQLEAMAKPFQRVSWCRICSLPRLFTMIGVSHEGQTGTRDTDGIKPPSDVAR